MTPLEVVIDLTDAHRRLIHAKVTLPVQPGTTAKFTTPLWLQESHVPNGPVGAIAGLFFSAKDRNLNWRHDSEAPFVFLVDVPSETFLVTASFSAVTQRYVTRRMLMLMWESVLLHPADKPIDRVVVKASITIPKNWSWSSSLKLERYETTAHHPHQTVVHFQPFTVEDLQDSPVLVGQYMSEVAIKSDKQHMLCIASGDDKHKTAPQEVMEKLAKLIKETRAVFGEAPYRRYRFLLMLSDLLVPEGYAVGGGIEHAESCHIVGAQRFLVDNQKLEWEGDILSHEYCHAWSGKYRRPVGHVPKDFTTPLDGRLLWVYEGLTQYYGLVLSVRCGIMSASALRVRLATTAAALANNAGISWRSVEDTGAGICLGKGLGKPRSSLWGNWSQGPDYYDAGVLLWLDVDTLIRQRSGGNSTLDDFCQRFFRKRRDSTNKKIFPYTAEELHDTLSEVLVYDWATFFKERVQDVAPDVNVDGIERGGYEFVYSDTPSYLQDTQMAKLDAIWNSLGVRVSSDGQVEDVRPCSPADVAKLAPTQAIVKIGTESFTVDVLLEAIRRAKDSESAITVHLEQDEDAWDGEIEYQGGLRYPKLVRKSSRHQDDLLASIVVPNCGDV